MTNPIGQDSVMTVTPEMIELLPCPFCGGEARRFTLDEPGDNFGGDVIACTGKCGASSHVEFGRKENLVSLWNTRMSQASPPPQTEGVWPNCSYWDYPCAPGTPLDDEVEHRREYLLLASYCAADNEACSETRPCSDCLAMCNVFDGGGKFLREFDALTAMKGTGDE